MAHFKSKNYEESAKLLQAGGGMTDKIFSPWRENNRFSRYASLLATSASHKVVEGLVAHDQHDPEAELKAFKEACKIIAKNSSSIDPEIIGDPLEQIEQLVDRLDPPKDWVASAGGLVRIGSIAAIILLIGVWVVLKLMKRSPS